MKEMEQSLVPSDSEHDAMNTTAAADINSSDVLIEVLHVTCLSRYGYSTLRLRVQQGSQATRRISSASWWWSAVRRDHSRMQSSVYVGLQSPARSFSVAVT